MLRFDVPHCNALCCDVLCCEVRGGVALRVAELAASRAIVAAVQARQIKAWGAEGVICGSALVKALGEAGSPEAGLKRMTELAQSLRGAI